MRRSIPRGHLRACIHSLGLGGCLRVTNDFLGTARYSSMPTLTAKWAEPRIWMSLQGLIRDRPPGGIGLHFDEPFLVGLPKDMHA